MNRITYFSFALIIVYFLPWLDLTLFTVSGFEVPSSIDKLLNFSEFLNDTKSAELNITYFLYLIPILATISIIGDFNKRNRNWLFNEFVAGLLATIYIYYLLTEMSIEPRKLISIGYIMTFIISAIGLILVILKSPKPKENTIETANKEKSTNKSDLFNQLEKIHNLKSAGIITDDIFDFEKKKILQEIENINSEIQNDKETIQPDLPSTTDFKEVEIKESFFSKYRLLIIFGTICILSFSIYYYNTNIKEPNSEISFDEINKSSENINVIDLQGLAKKHFEKYKTRFETETTTNNDTDTTYVGDFNNDGLLDVALFYGLDPKEGNYNVGGGMLLYKNNGNGIEFFKQYDPEYLFNIDRISNSKIYLKRYEYKDDDGRCCPSIITEVEISVSGENIAEKEIK